VGEVQTVESGERKGLRLIYVRGPDGVTLEFLQLPEDAPKWADGSPTSREEYGQQHKSTSRFNQSRKDE
jgi:anion-transporting  ArsA/GET3 family ATPase